uniref:Ig-like domain-containing protein n=1 Tax=Salarias fasciatus TaxID=181472 RepID=A0A672IN74_SALFA
MVFFTLCPPGPQSSISGIVQAPPSAAVHPGESVSLQCSVLSDSEKKTCSEDYRVHWFRAGSHQSHPDFIYTHGANAECGHSSHKCFYSFSKKISDTGLYYCIGTETLEMTFVRGVFLKVKRPQSSISGIFQAPPSAAVHPGESVSLQCSVLSDSEKKTCSEDYRVHWFRAGSHQSHPDFIYTHGGNAECGNSSQKCFYSFSKKVSVSDAGTYYCAVAACGEVMFGNGAKLDIKGQFNHQFLKLIVSYWFRTP